MLWTRPANIFDAPVLGDLHAASGRPARPDVPSDEFLAAMWQWKENSSGPSACPVRLPNAHIFIAGRGIERYRHAGLCLWVPVQCQSTARLAAP